MPVDVTGALRHITIKIEDLTDTGQVFYVTNIRARNSERGRVDKEGAEPYGYVFDLVDEDGEWEDTAFSCSLGVMEDIDNMVALAGPDEIYGPCCMVRSGKTKRLTAARKPQRAAPVQAQADEVLETAAK